MTDCVSKSRKIEINELPKQIPNFKETYESKDSLIKKWLIKWITTSLKSNKIKVSDLLPKKSAIASYLGVSIGTVQNAVRYAEDGGYLVSKQRIGTMIADMTNPINTCRKLTSKRDKIIEQIKKIIVDNRIKINQSVPSSRKIAAMLGVSSNTTRLAYEYLCSEGILESRLTRGNDANWVLKEIPVLGEENIHVNQKVSSDTLVEKVADDLKKYISINLKVSDKLPAHSHLADILNVSIKTVHDAMKTLINDGILLARRGRYGTIVTKMPDSNILAAPKETSIFAKAEDAAFYSYQKVEDYLVNMIIKDYELGDKLPSMDELSKKLDVSTNTIRKALQNLSARGIVQFGRGRYGGTFITDIPENNSEEAFKWLSVNPRYVKTFAN